MNSIYNVTAPDQPRTSPWYIYSYPNAIDLLEIFWKFMFPYVSSSFFSSCYRFSHFYSIVLNFILALYISFSALFDRVSLPSLFQIDWSKWCCFWMRSKLWLWTWLHKPYISEGIKVPTWGTLIKMSYIQYEIMKWCTTYIISLIFMNRFIELPTRDGLSGLGTLFLLVHLYVNTLEY